MPNAQTHTLIGTGADATAALLDKDKHPTSHHIAITPVAFKNLMEVGHDHII